MFLFPGSVRKSGPCCPGQTVQVFGDPRPTHLNPRSARAVASWGMGLQTRAVAEHRESRDQRHRPREISPVPQRLIFKVRTTIRLLDPPIALPPGGVARITALPVVEPWVRWRWSYRSRAMQEIDLFDLRCSCFEFRGKQEYGRTPAASEALSGGNEVE